MPLNPHTSTHARTQAHTQLKSSKNAMHEYCKVDINELEQFKKIYIFWVIYSKNWEMKEYAKNERIHENCKD